MRRLLALCVPSAFLLMGSGCVAHYHQPRSYESHAYEYRYHGAHPEPSGGWCTVQYAHTHDYAPD
ncbi:MAG TPA: hypothetical protein VLQ93_06735, partial [Myxococcaceae bacterium]|nr:hypothetical protein [Myxococcaceae bacterium]